MRRPRAALTMRITQAVNYVEPRDSISHDWITVLEGWGVAPFPIPNSLRDGPAYVESLDPDVLILTGGDDPGATPERDTLETALIASALKKRLPILGVCRGMQMINRYFGGTCVAIADHVATRHRVAVDPAWRDHYGDEETVNSFHDLAIARDGLGAGLEATASADDGSIEAFRHPGHDLAAVMWHPERDGAPPGDRRLIASLTGIGGAR